MQVSCKRSSVAQWVRSLTGVQRIPGSILGRAQKMFPWLLTPLLHMIMGQLQLMTKSSQSVLIRVTPDCFSPLGLYYCCGQHWDVPGCFFKLALKKQQPRTVFWEHTQDGPARPHKLLKGITYCDVMWLWYTNKHICAQHVDIVIFANWSISKFELLWPLTP